MGSGERLGGGQQTEANKNGRIYGSTIVEENADHMPYVFLLLLGCGRRRVKVLGVLHCCAIRWDSVWERLHLRLVGVFVSKT